MSTSNGHEGISNCYVFKSQLQEYALKEQLSTPVYETLREGPSHEPFFKSTVVVDNVAYESLPGFFTRKAAEQSAAEIALRELAKTRGKNGSIISPVHETGLCKNMLQEYAQKMNYAVPSYVCSKVDQSDNSLFSCTVEIAGMQYIGAGARTKKEAEIKAARTALLAIQANTVKESAPIPGENSQLIVVPRKRNGNESHTAEKTKLPLQPKKTQMKKKGRNKKHPKNKGNEEKSCPMEVTVNTGNSSEVSGVFVSSQDGQAEQPGGVEIKCVSGCDMESNNQQEQHASDMQSNGNEQGSSNAETLSELPVKDSASLVTEVNSLSGAVQEVLRTLPDSAMGTLPDSASLVTEVNTVSGAVQEVLRTLPESAMGTLPDSASLVTEVNTVSGAVQEVLHILPDSATGTLPESAMVTLPDSAMVTLPDSAMVTLPDSAMGSLVAVSNQNEDERSTTDELKQRVGEQFQSSQIESEPMDVMNQS